MMCVCVAFEGVFCKCCNTRSLSIGFSEFLINQMSTLFVGDVFTTTVYFFELGFCVLYPFEAW